MGLLHESPQIFYEIQKLCEQLKQAAKVLWELSCQLSKAKGINVFDIRKLQSFHLSQNISDYINQRQTFIN